MLGAVDIRQGRYLPNAPIVDHAYDAAANHPFHARYLLLQLSRKELSAQEAQPLKVLRQVGGDEHLVLGKAVDQLPDYKLTPTPAPLPLDDGDAPQLVRLPVRLDAPESDDAGVFAPHDDELLRLQPLPVQTQPRHRIADERQVITRSGVDYVGR